MTEHPAHAAVGELIRTQTLRIDVTADIHYTVRAPCLLQQLADAIATGSEDSGGRSVPGSRPPIAVDAWDLWRHITTSTHAWAAHLGLDRRSYLAPPQAGHVGTPPIGQLLRGCAANATSTGNVAIADAIHRLADQWCRQITAMLTGRVEQRAVRGARCHDLYCQATTLTETRDGETYRVPAVVLIVQDHEGVTLRWLACRACGWCGHIADDGSVVDVSVDDSAGQAA